MKIIMFKMKKYTRKCQQMRNYIKMVSEIEDTAIEILKMTYRQEAEKIIKTASVTYKVIFNSLIYL